jgi:hypothetical protein
MRFSNTNIDDTTLLIDENEMTVSPTSSSSSSSSLRDHHSSIQCHTLRQDRMPCSADKPSPSAEYRYTEIVKGIGNNEFMEEKRLLKRASWSPAVAQEHGLPPSGKRTDSDDLTPTKNPNRVRMRPKTARYYQPQPQPQPQYQHHHHHPPIPLTRPVSFNERYNRHLIDHQQQKLANQSLVSYPEKTCFFFSGILKLVMQTLMNSLNV